MGYLYETHLHTSEASACAMVPGADYISYMMEKGYAGMIVTDHFFNGNSCVPGRLSWEKRIEQYVSGFEHAKDAARGTGFQVLFGVEFNFEGDEFLLYGVDKEWLLSHPAVMQYTRAEVFREVHRAGGIMIHAHPYRERGYLDTIHLTPSACDGIEIYNGGNKAYQNALAYQYDLELDLPVTAGSDIHYFQQGYPMGGMEFPERIGSIQEFSEAVTERAGVPMALYDDHWVPVTDLKEHCIISQKPSLPVIWH